MYGSALDSAGREGKDECCAVVPGVPLIHVMAAEDLAGLASDDIERAGVEVGQVGGESLRGPEAVADLLHGVAIAGLWNRSRARPMTKDGNDSENRVLYFQRKSFASLPRAEIAGNIFFVNGDAHGLGKQFVPGAGVLG